MNLRFRLQSSNSSESSESLQGLSSCASCSAPTSAASRPMNKRKSADANNLGVDDQKQVWLLAYLVRMLGPRKDAPMLRGIRRGIGWNTLSRV